MGEASHESSAPETSSLPPGFVWGVSTAAYQVEGATSADGRSMSIWDTFAATSGRIRDGDTAEVACDHYRLWPDDLGLLQQLNIGTYRFSVAWPRIMPEGTGRLNPAGVAHYDRLVDGLLGLGITPMITLYHWDLPQVLQDRGGWPERSTAEAFADYAGSVAAVLGDRVQNWITLSEPMCISWLGHLTGDMAPGERDLHRAVRASHHTLLGHGLAVEAVRANAGAQPAIGLHHFLSPIEAATDRPEDLAAASRVDGHLNRWWLDPMFARGYPEDMIATYGVEPPVQEGDLAIIATPTDFLGIAYYYRQLVVDDPSAGVPHARQVPVAHAAQTAMGWEVYPDGLEQILVRVWEDYRPQRILVAENGSAFYDEVGAEGTIEDDERAAFLERHIAACARARARGVPVDGYFAWSLLDNFEWGEGYSKRFGLVHVDYATQRRTIKQSGTRYADLIAAHRRRSNPKAPH
jgi:beta-glucosidase